MKLTVKNFNLVPCLVLWKYDYKWVYSPGNLFIAETYQTGLRVFTMAANSSPVIKQTDSLKYIYIFIFICKRLSLVGFVKKIILHTTC